MSLRAVWVIKLPTNTNKNPAILYSRKFPLVEEKAKVADGEKYVPIPNKEDFMHHVILEVGRNNASKFIVSRDSCDKEDEKPVFDIDLGNGEKLWPVTVIEQNNILFCGLSYVEQGTENRPPLLSIPCISVTFSFLRCLTNFLRVTSSQEFKLRVNELPAFMNEAAPFGVPRDTDYESIAAKLSDKPSNIPKTQKQPAWKPVLHTGKSTIFLSISECIQAIQCEQEEAKDSCQVYGTITCKADLEGATPDITLNISHLNEGLVTALDHLLIHPCVQSADSKILEKDDQCVRPSPRRVRFIPPLDSFTLCHYTVSRIKELPIFGVYKMKCDQKSASLSVKLQLSDQVKNNFEYAELQIPFFDRGVITVSDSNPSQGSISLSPDRRVVIWNIGQKFPSKSLDASLTATVQFADGPTISNLAETDFFCTSQNAYCQLYFKVNDFTYSGCYIDTKSLQVSPNTKFKLTTNRDFLSTAYKIWNSDGEVLSTGK